MSRPPMLSKTRFLSGCQCRLRLWYDVHWRDLATPPDEATRARFDVGHEVGALARERWPGGAVVEFPPWQQREAVERTGELMRDETLPAIYEAAIAHRGAITRVDVLARAPGGAWDLVEVKSGTKVKPPNDLDAAVQYWILRGAGLDVRRAGILVLDRDYVYGGGRHDLEALFRFEDLTADCEAMLDEVGELVEEFQSVAARHEAPDIGIGDHCFTPYECPYYAHCSRGHEFPEHPIDLLPRLKGERRAGLVELGVETVENIPSGYDLTDRQERVRQCIVSGRPWVSGALGALLEDVQWPLHALDFEAAAFAIPRYQGTRPYDAVPFQFSRHRQAAPDAEPEHVEFLATGRGDPREALARALLEAVGDKGTILVYSGYESRVITDLAGWLPHLADALSALKPRLVDLLKILEGHYCHPDFNGSTSIKQVLPVLVPGLSYEDLDIADGQAAARAWMELIEARDWVQRQNLEAALREYCALDSLAMLKLREALLEQA